jgi:hypothetical protein
MEKTMQQKNLYLVVQRVPEALCLPRCGVKGDGEIAGMLACQLLGRRKTENVGRFILFAKGPVEPPNLLIRGQ